MHHIILLVVPMRFKNPKAAEKRRKWQRKENKKKSKRKYRAFLVKKRRDAGRYGNGDGKDYDHTE